jgi:hypothetical protein
MRPNHFQIEEMFPKWMVDCYYPTYHDRLWLMMDERILISADNIREIYGTVVANDYLWGGKNKDRGWRPWGCNVGADLSQHKSGRALDCIPTKAGVDKVRKDIIEDVHPYAFRFITAVEMDVPWLHFDCRAHDKKQFGVYQFRA